MSTAGYGKGKAKTVGELFEEVKVSSHAITTQWINRPFEECLLMRVCSPPMIGRKAGEHSPGFRRQSVASSQRSEFVRLEPKRAG